MIPRRPSADDVSSCSQLPSSRLGRLLLQPGCICRLGACPFGAHLLVGHGQVLEDGLGGRLWHGWNESMVRTYRSWTSEEVGPCVVRQCSEFPRCKCKWCSSSLSFGCECNKMQRTSSTWTIRKNEYPPWKKLVLPNDGKNICIHIREMCVHSRRDGNFISPAKFWVVLLKPKISLLACDAFLRACLNFSMFWQTNSFQSIWNKPWKQFKVWVWFAQSSLPLFWL